MNFLEQVLYSGGGRIDVQTHKMAEDLQTQFDVRHIDKGLYSFQCLVMYQHFL